MSDKSLRFAIFGNQYQAKKSAAIQKILSLLNQREGEILIDRSFYDFLTKGQHLDLDVDEVFTGDDFDADFAVSMGGDGTLLKTAARVGRKNIPIIGVNIGRLGFLADVNPTELERAIAKELGLFGLEDGLVDRFADVLYLFLDSLVLAVDRHDIVV